MHEPPPQTQTPTQQHPIRVLLVEDNPADARLLVESLKDAGPGGFQITHVTRLSAAEEALGRDAVDVVALDLSLPDSTGLATAERVQAAAPGVPVVILTGLQDEALALQAVRQGVQDYLVKGQGEGGLAARALRYAVERRRAEAALHESEKRLRTVLEHLPVGVWFADPTGKPLYVNPAAREIWGGVRDVEMQDYGQYKGWRVDTGELLGPDDWAMARALRTGEVTAGDVVEIEAFDGTRKTIRTAGVPIRDAAGKVSGAVVINEDVTERRRVEQAVRESEQRLVSLFEALPLGVAIMDADGKLVVSNREMDAYLPSGAIPSRDEARAWRWRATHPDGRRVDPADYPGARAMRGERVVPGVEFRYTRDDGTEVWTQVAAVPLRAADGRVTGNVLVINDIDALKRTEAELRRAHDFTESLIETARSIVLVLDAKGQIVRFNSYFKELTGRRLEEVQGASWFDTFLPERDREQIRALFGRALTVERVSGNVNAIVTKDGRERDIEWFDAPLTNARGELIGLLCTGQDVTERKAAEEALRAAEKQLRTITDAAPALIAYVDRDGVYRLNNRAYETWFGQRREAMTGRHMKQVLGPAAWKKLRPHVERALAGEEVHYEDMLPYASGGRRWVSVSYTPDRDAHGTVQGFVVLVTDIGEIKASAEAVQRSEARLAAVVGTAVDAIITIDERGMIDTVNPATERLFGYARDELVGRNVAVLMPEPYAGEHDEYLGRYLRTGEARIIGIGRDVIGLRRDGGTFPLTLSVSEFHIGDRRMFTGILHDISNRRRLEREVLEASANEQRRIGHDLHDGLCQQILGAAFGLEVLAKRLQNATPAEVPAARKLLDLLNDTLRQARALAHGLNPIDVRAGGLPKAAAELAAKVKEVFGVACHFRTSGNVEIADNTTATHLYRIAQEAISNAIKHGRCRHLDLELHNVNGTLTLGVKDDGKGFNADATLTAGRGLQIMQYRAALIGATLAVRPRPAGGTQVTAVLRLAAGAAVDPAPVAAAGGAKQKKPRPSVLGLKRPSRRPRRADKAK